MLAVFNVNIYPPFNVMIPTAINHCNITIELILKTCPGIAMTLFDPQAHCTEPPGYSKTLSTLTYGHFVATHTFKPNILTAISAAVADQCLWFQHCTIASLLWCIIFTRPDKLHSRSPAAANHSWVTLASRSAHLGCTHWINCSTDLVNCLSAADVRKRREDSNKGTQPCNAASISELSNSNNWKCGQLTR